MINFSAVLRAHGVKRGDVVALYLPMVIELAVAMLACARIGAMHSVVFAGFSAESLATRIVDAKWVEERTIFYLIIFLIDFLPKNVIFHKFSFLCNY